MFQLSYQLFYACGSVAEFPSRRAQHALSSSTIKSASTSCIIAPSAIVPVVAPAQVRQGILCLSNTSMHSGCSRRTSAMIVSFVISNRCLILHNSQLTTRGYMTCSLNTVCTSDNTAAIPAATCKNPMFQILSRPDAWA